jgi:hypothetical protein
MEKARVAESGIVDGDPGGVKYDVPPGYVDWWLAPTVRSKWYSLRLDRT